MQHKSETILSLIAMVLFSACCFALLLAIGGYGPTLFLAMPFVLGFITVLAYSWRERKSPGKSVGAVSLVLIAFSVLLLLTGFEGAICLLMAFPLTLLLALFGGVIALLIHDLRDARIAARKMGWILILVIPTLLGAEKAWSPDPPLRGLESYVDVDAPPEIVWNHVFGFPELPEPSEWLFRMGIAYPTSATLIGSGVGATRYCMFTTGAFVEPITVWDPPRRLTFNVIDTPPPMKEWSIWNNIHPPHLDGHFVSEKGEFLLEPLANGGTRLIGTSWYRHDIRPAFYWRWWSDYVIHKIHLRVLEQIKLRAEQSASN